MADAKYEAVSPEDVQYFGSGAGIRELSNFYQLAAPIVIDGKQFITTEHAYQALYRCTEASQRAFVFPDGQLSTFEGGMQRVVDKPADLEKKKKHWGAKGGRRAMAGIVAKMAVDAKRAKRLGIELRRARDAPEDRKLIESLFKRVLHAKFSGDAQLRKVLLDTGDKVLVEFDRAAGRRTEAGSPPLFTGLLKGGKVLGQNLMGRLLMETRGQLRAEACACATGPAIIRTSSSVGDSSSGTKSQTRARAADRFDDEASVRTRPSSTVILHE